MKQSLELSGDANIPSMPLTNAEVNHLRRLLAWMRCEYMLDESMQHGFVEGAAWSIEHGFTSQERGSEIVEQQASKIAKVPIYVRQAVKMLTKKLRQHEEQSGIVEVKP